MALIRPHFSSARERVVCESTSQSFWSHTTADVVSLTKHVSGSVERRATVAACKLQNLKQGLNLSRREKRKFEACPEGPGGQNAGYSVTPQPGSINSDAISRHGQGSLLLHHANMFNQLRFGGGEDYLPTWQKHISI
jgi:hypothetical protein